MFGMLRQRRGLALSLSLLKRNRSFCSSASLLKHQHLSDSSSSSTHIPDKKSWGKRLLKFGIFSALTGAVGTAGYATYAYSLEEVENKAKGLQLLATNITTDDAPVLEKVQALLYSAAVKVPAKSAELYLDLRRSIDEQIWKHTQLLPDMHYQEKIAGVFTLVLDLDETLIYSDWKPERGWKTFKRPGVDAFLANLAQHYEIVLYSDQPVEYVEPIVRRLNRTGFIRYTLSRPATRYQNGQRFRDLSKLNRDPSKVLYLSGHALESTLQPENSVPVKAWKLEPNDTALLDLLPFLEYVGKNKPDDIRTTLESYKGHDIPSEFKRRMQGRIQPLAKRF